MKISKGEQKIIYKKQGNIFGCYYIKVLGQNKRHITAIDLDDKQIEKTFNTSRVLEVVDISTPGEVIQEKLTNHINEYKNNKKSDKTTLDYRCWFGPSIRCCYSNGIGLRWSFS